MGLPRTTWKERALKVAKENALCRPRGKTGGVVSGTSALVVDA